MNNKKLKKLLRDIIKFTELELSSLTFQTIREWEDKDGLKKRIKKAIKDIDKA